MFIEIPEVNGIPVFDLSYIAEVEERAAKVARAMDDGSSFDDALEEYSLSVVTDEVLANVYA